MERVTDWSMKEVWNGAALRPDREMKVRDYCWASELAKPLVDRYLAMKATKPTNPPNMRSRRKFLMGNIIEEIQGIIISTLGLKVDKQQEVWTHGIIPVKGKIDFLVEGTPDYEKARHDINKLGFSEEFIGYLLSVIDKFEEKIGQKELAPMVRECKSCSQYVLSMLQEGGSIIGHKLQLFHYLKGLNLPLGYVDYISKDDALMEDCRVEYPDKALEKRYNDDLEDLHAHLVNNEMPPPAPLIIFEGKFKQNFSVEYSNYLTMVYGFKTPEEYRNSIKAKISGRNRLLARIKMIEAGELTPTGKAIVLTPKNQIAIEEMAKEGLDAFALAKKAVVVEEEED